MKPAWDQLMDAFADSKTALVADVDCTGAGQDLCEEYEIQGFPTLKYGDPFMLEDYEGGRDYESLKKFADENLGPVCSPVNIGLCDAATKAEIEKYQAMSEADLAALVEEKSKAIEALEEVFDKEVEKLQAAYEKLEEDKDAGVKAIRQSGLGFMKAVMATNKKKAASDEL